MEMIEKKLVLQDTNGLHAKLASEIVRSNSKYDVMIELIYNNQTVDAKSILGLMSLAIPYGEDIEINVVGPDAEQALKDLEKILG